MFREDGISVFIIDKCRRKLKNTQIIAHTIDVQNIVLYNLNINVQNIVLDGGVYYVGCQLY